MHNITQEKIRKIGLSITFDMGFVSRILNRYDIILRGVGSGGSNIHGVNETIKLKDVKTLIKEIIVFLCTDL